MGHCCSRLTTLDVDIPFDVGLCTSEPTPVSSTSDKSAGSALEPTAAAEPTRSSSGSAPTIVYTPRGHATPPKEPSTDPPIFNASLYPSLNAQRGELDDDHRDDDAKPEEAAAPMALVYSPRGHALPPHVAEEGDGDERGSCQTATVRYDPALYPSLHEHAAATAATAATAALTCESERGPCCYSPRGHAAPPNPSSGAPSAPDPSLYPSLAPDTLLADDDGDEDEGERAEEVRRDRRGGRWGGRRQPEPPHMGMGDT
jgi:hypothetical protein